MLVVSFNMIKENYEFIKAAAAGEFAKERFFYNVEPAQWSLLNFDYIILWFLHTRI